MSKLNVVHENPEAQDGLDIIVDRDDNKSLVVFTIKSGETEFPILMDPTVAVGVAAALLAAVECLDLEEPEENPPHSGN